MNIKVLNNNDLSNIINILNYYNLITQDIDLNKQFFLGFKQQQDCIAIGALEYHRPYALIRSVAVNSQEQHKGYAKIICQALIQQALSENIGELYLLTETAEASSAREMAEGTDQVRTSWKLESSVCRMSEKARCSMR